MQALQLGKIQCRSLYKEVTKNGKNSSTYFRCFDFITQFNLPVDKIDTTNIFITAKHITTANLSTLKKYGLLNLKDMLEKETPLSQFLDKGGIKFDVDGKKIKVLQTELDLFRCNNICKPCSIDRNKCIQFSPEYRTAIDRIHIKLYHDKAEIEVFLSGTEDKIEKYPSIKSHPEILTNIDKLLISMETPLDLSRQWAELQNAQYYILEFDINIRDLEYIPRNIYDADPSYDLFYRYFDFLNYTESHFIANLIPNRFYSNVFLVKNSLDVFWGESKEFGQISPETIIPYKDLRISRKTLS